MIWKLIWKYFIESKWDLSITSWMAIQSQRHKNSKENNKVCYLLVFDAGT